MRGARAVGAKLLKKVGHGPRTPQPIRATRILVFCARFLEALNRIGSRVFSRQFPKGSPKQQRSETSRSACSVCFGVSLTKIVFAVSRPPLICSKPLHVTSMRYRVQRLHPRTINAHHK